MNDLNVSELLEYDSEDGVVRFAGQRAVIIDGVANGSFRKELVDQFGLTAARAILTRFGYVQGWRMAEATQNLFQWESEKDWHHACGRIHMLGGMYRLKPGPVGSLTEEGMTLIESFEAEQHIAHFGRSDMSVCWTISGLTSGYLSRALGKEIFVLEESCIGHGDATCHLVGRTLEEWGDGRAEEIRYFRAENLNDWLEPSLHQITEELKAAEKLLRIKKRVVAVVGAGIDNKYGIIAHSADMRKVSDLARRVAKVDCAVLITGESGAGKELIANVIHHESARSDGPFIAVNCGAITETLLESELFGHARGAFSGAMQHRIGLFEAANGGILFLDEIGDISPGMQVKLLRVLQEHEIRRVGENNSRPIDVRVIAATNRDLATEIEEGRFRADLFYRLNVVQLHVPPLRNRRQDILPLARLLLTKASLGSARTVAGLSPRAADQIHRYDWPGNVRELENAMERAVAVGHARLVEIDELPEEVRTAVPIPTLDGPSRTLKGIEKDYILAVLHANEGNQARTARELGIGSATLYRKLKTYGTPEAGTASKPGGHSP